MTTSEPRVIGRYEIRKELGRGMMGVVYEAVDTALGRRIAIKTIDVAYAVAPEERVAFEERFLTEARAAAGIAHPNIVTVHDVGRDAATGKTFMALEYLEGRDLADCTAAGTSFDWREALRITERVADALHAAHSRGIIHRDIKPSNIMLLPSGQPKIMDFGIAKVPTSQLTMAGQVFGTPAYMSPEQALGDPLDTRSDLFSLGAVLYQLLTGGKAFPGDSLPKIIAMVVRQDPPAPSQAVPSIPPDVDYVIARALAKAPGDRYPDGRTMAQDIQDVLEDRPPRHRAGWNLPSRVEGTMVAGSSSPSPPTLKPSLPGTRSLPTPGPGASHLDAELDDLLAGLQEATEAPRPRTDENAPPRQRVPQTSPRAAPAPAARAALVPRVAAAGAGAGSAKLWAGGAAAILVAAVLGTLLSRNRTEPEASAIAPPTAEAPRPAPRLPIAAPPATLPPAGVEADPGMAERTQELTHPDDPAGAPEAPTDLAPASDLPTGTARLSIDFEHPLESGTVRVWVDDVLVLEEDIRGRLIKKVVGLRIRKGKIEHVVAVAPGRHEVRLQVAWDDNLKTQSLYTTFRAGDTRHLQARLGRIRNNLSLEWE